MIDKQQFRELVVRPTLQHLDPVIPYSEAAVELLVGTAMVESGLTYLKQLGAGPALGVYQMEPATHEDIWHNFIVYRDAIADKLSSGQAHELIGNMNYATAMARIHYYRVPEALPDNTPYSLGQYWKDHYNTHLGKGSVDKYVQANS